MVAFGDVTLCRACKGRGSVKGRGICRKCQGGGTIAGEGVRCECRCGGCPNATRMIVCRVCVERVSRYGVCLSQIIDVSELQSQEEWEQQIIALFA
jgi:RecJ-like exonuclease